MSEREAAKTMREAAEYLDAIELEMIRNNADMSLDAMMPPSAVAHNLRAAIRALPLPDPSPAPAMGDDELRAAIITAWRQGQYAWKYNHPGTYGEECDQCAASAVLAVASPILTQRARDKALEDAAAIANNHNVSSWHNVAVAKAILSLKGTPHV